MFPLSLKLKTHKSEVSLPHCLGLALLFETAFCLILSTQMPSTTKTEPMPQPKAVTVLIKAPIKKKTAAPATSPTSSHENKPQTKTEHSSKKAPLVQKTAPPSHIEPSKKSEKATETKEKKQKKTQEKKKTTISEPQEEAAPLMKNLAAPKASDNTKTASQHQTLNIEDTLSISELDNFKKQLARCWTMPPQVGEPIVVTLEVHALASGSISEVKVVSPKPTNAAERRAVKLAKATFVHPDCTPLDLPKERYNQWQSFFINFSPKEM